MTIKNHSATKIFYALSLPGEPSANKSLLPYVHAPTLDIVIPDGIPFPELGTSSMIKLYAEAPADLEPVFSLTVVFNEVYAIHWLLDVSDPHVINLFNAWFAQDGIQVRIQPEADDECVVTVLEIVKSNDMAKHLFDVDRSGLRGTFPNIAHVIYQTKLLSTTLRKFAPNVQCELYSIVGGRDYVNWLRKQQHEDATH